MSKTQLMEWWWEMVLKAERIAGDYMYQYKILGLEFCRDEAIYYVELANRIEEWRMEK